MGENGCVAWGAVPAFAAVGSLPTGSVQKVDAVRESAECTTRRRLRLGGGAHHDLADVYAVWLRERVGDRLGDGVGCHRHSRHSFA